MEQADIMEEMMRALGVQDVHIFAHDYGDTVAQELIHRSSVASHHSTSDSWSLIVGVW